MEENNKPDPDDQNKAEESEGVLTNKNDVSVEPPISEYTGTKSDDPQEYHISNQGNGKEYFGIVIINWLLTIVTLGLYYPWAKAKQLQYLYGTTDLNGDKFAFHGTGKEMFIGFLKALFLIALFGGFIALFIYLEMPDLGIFAIYGSIALLMPFILHGSYRYRMSRTSWRGIRFGYRGKRGELAGKFYLWAFFTIITFGIYGAWLSINLRTYLLNHVQMGNLKFKYSGNGGEYFGLNLKGYFLCWFTLGIYIFWWQKDLFNYYVDHLSAGHGDKQVKFKSTATGGGFFRLIMVNLLILIFTLGFGYAWAVTRTLNFAFSNIKINGNIDLEELEQTEEVYKDAMGEDVGDMFDMDILV